MIDIRYYFKKRLLRFYKPVYLLIPPVSLAYYFFLNLNTLSFLPFWMIGYMKNFGVGQYFITVYLQWIVIFGIIFYVSKNRPWFIIYITIFFFIIHSLWYLNKGILSPFLYKGDTLYARTWYAKIMIFTYLPHISLGLVFGKFYIRFKQKIRKIHIGLLIPIIILLFSKNLIWSRTGWMDFKSITLRKLIILDISIVYSFLVFLTLFYIFDFIPPRTFKPLSWIGIRSLEIFLLQSAFFWLIYSLSKLNDIFTIFLYDLIGFLLSLIAILLILILFSYYDKYVTLILKKFKIKSD